MVTEGPRPHMGLFYTERDAAVTLGALCSVPSSIQVETLNEGQQKAERSVLDSGTM